MVAVFVNWPLVAVTVTKPVSPEAMTSIVLGVDKVAVCAGDPLSVAFTLNELFPTVVGAPEMAPVEELRVRPLGRVPEPIE